MDGADSRLVWDVHQHIQSTPARGEPLNVRPQQQHLEKLMLPRARSQNEANLSQVQPHYHEGTSASSPIMLGWETRFFLVAVGRRRREKSECHCLCHLSFQLSTTWRQVRPSAAGSLGMTWQWCWVIPSDQALVPSGAEWLNTIA
jgi:hypothetical protein